MSCMYTIEEKTQIALFVAVTIDLIRYLCAFPLQLYNFNVD